MGAIWGALLTLAALAAADDGGPVRLEPKEVRLVFHDKGRSASSASAVGVLLSPGGWASLDSDVVRVDCEGSECRPLRSDDWEEGRWVAVLHFPSTLAFTRTTVVDQVRQAILWGASAVILLAFNPHTPTHIELREKYVTKPVVLITSNITKILRALANSTRVLVSMSRGGEGAAVASTLTLWATCGRHSAFSSTSHAGRQWEGTVCMEAPEAGDYGPSETSTFLTLSAFASLICLLMHSCGGFGPTRLEGDEEDGGLRASVTAFVERRRLAKKQEAVWRLGAASWSGESGESCPICLEEFALGDVLRRLPCAHRLHSDCLDPWLLSAGTCPLCKRRVVIPSSA